MNVQRILDAKGSGEVFTLDQDATLADFVRTACEKNVGAMLVTNADGNIVGILTERDILHQLHAGRDFKRTKASDVMTRKLATVQVDEDIRTAMDYMITLNIRHLPVLKGGRSQD
jgi:CBS domain-containing protein